MSIAPTIITDKFETLSQLAIDPIKLELIRLTLSTAVPLAIADLQKFGGISDWHMDRARSFANELGGGGDTLLYYVKGKSGHMMAKFCEVVAIMAFFPGGVTVFGLHFEANSEVPA